ncbi:hypothetical protein PoB_005633600 [Plakobranchus ocellatus]|uniref:Uncharacterized protein n=1 Tax=Plakobranchus ocellatus TaxID=259542 RepID=A0AAV4C3A6_9GAST|nr:hypothetical protein PoB_005633600 [Plakobranchus ocellatus]
MKSDQTETVTQQYSGQGATKSCPLIKLSRVRAPPSAPRPDGGPKSLRSPCCGLAIHKIPNPTLIKLRKYSGTPSRFRGAWSILFAPDKVLGSVGGTVDSESALRSAGTPLSRVRAPSPAPWPDGGRPESLRSPYCGLAI